ncbi:hypothetical protein MMC30_003462 [Trapelia coarctata]|nr:hypothetical protein [Trapelia coarctata]
MANVARVSSPRTENTQSPSRPRIRKNMTSILDTAAIPHRSVTSSTQTSAPSIQKKNSSSIFGFLKTKEPSTQAWLEYQESICKQQASQNGKVSAVGMPMVSSAKLPPTVPKVNSKWDGVPETVAQREKERKAAKRESHKVQAKLLSDAMTGGLGNTRSRSSSRSRSKALYALSTENSVSSFGTPPMTSGSAASSTPDLVWTPISTEPTDFASMLGNSTKSGSSTPLSEVGSFNPYLPDALRPQEGYSRSGSGDLPQLPKFPLVNTPLTVRSTTEPLPLTPQHTRNLHSNASLTPESAIKTITTDIQTTTLNVPAPKQVMLKSSGVNVLGPPVRPQRKAKASPSSTDEAQTIPVPSPQPSILKKDSMPQGPYRPIRPLVSSYSISTQSEAAASRNSSKNRLVAPWDSPESPAILVPPVDAERSLTPTPPEPKGKTWKGRNFLFKS